MRYLFVFAAFAALLFAFSCGGDDDDAPAGSQTTTASPVGSGDPLEASLASILLQASDVPAGLQSSGLNYSRNSDLGSSEAETASLDALGRLLGVDQTFVPTEDLPENEVVRGGIQNSASVYTNPDGASQTFKETQDSVRGFDWKTSYPDLSDFSVHEVDRTVGDESIWLRISGTESCAVQTAAGATPAPSATCAEPHIIHDDYVIFRAGRVRSLVKVLSSHPVSSPEDVYEDQVQAWAQLVVDRANQTFPVIP